MRNHPYLNLMKKRTIVFDGAMGTQIQKCNLTPVDFGAEELEGANDHLVITRPDVIRDIHRLYLEAGADVIETNTFGASRLKLEEYGLTTVAEHNREAAVLARASADEFSTEENPRFAFGSIGPTGMLPSSDDEALSAITYDQLRDIFQEQAYHLIEGGVHGLLIETSQDILEVKAAIAGCHLAKEQAAKAGLIQDPGEIILQVQVTLDSNGRMLLGTDIKAALAILEPLPVDVIGLNCSTGPVEMRESVRYLLENSSKPISVIPNAGMPVNVDGQAVYRMNPGAFAKEIFSFIEEFGLHVTGGCCGTSPEHIKALKQIILDHPEVKPREPQNKRLAMVASSMTAVSLLQEPAPALIGERLNAQGSRKMKDLLINDDFGAMLGLARSQEESGAHLLDLCLASNERDDEVGTMRRLVKLLSASIATPLMIDSTESNVLEAALKQTPGRPVVNSINLEGDGKTRIHTILPLVKEFGAAVVALTIDEKGMADTADWKLEVAQRIHQIATEEYQLLPQDLLFDCLTFTLATGEEKYNRSAVETLEAIRRIKKELPGALTTLGLSNVSFGLAPHARKILNSVFLYHAVKAGLDTAILNPRDIIPYGELTDEDKRISEDLIFYRHENALPDFIAYFEKRAPVKGKKQEDSAKVLSSLEPIERVRYQVINRLPDAIEDTLAEILKEKSAVETINDVLLPAMKTVGDKFGSGELILPFVLQSAEVMKRAVAYVEQFLDKNDSAQKGTIVLATVYGDVHDIGKNLVKTILSNNGFSVIDLGKQVPVATILEEAEKNSATAIGLSALLVSTSKQMGICIEELAKGEREIPVIVGGAAINRKFSYQISYQGESYYDPGVFYAKDAFEGLNIANTLISKERKDFVDKIKANAESYRVTAREGRSKTAESAASASATVSLRPADIVKPPFVGRKVLRGVDFEKVFELIDQKYLFRFKWGVRSKGDEFKKQVDEIFRPRLLEMAEEAKIKNWMSLDLVYGYFPAQSNENTIEILGKDGGISESFTFPRQVASPGRCLSDYIAPAAKTNENDYLAMSAVTSGQAAADVIHELQEAGELEKSYLFAGFSTQMAEALAEYIHREIRREWGLAENRGLRYSFGYPACPELSDQEKLYRLLHPEEIGLGLTEAWQMVPEQSTSALIFHHPDCEYFSM